MALGTELWTLKRGDSIGWSQGAPVESGSRLPDSTEGHLQVAFLPPYATDLNPVEICGVVVMSCFS